MSLKWQTYASPPLFVPFSLRMETKSKGLREQQQHHKKLLAAMLSQDSFDSVHSSVPSATEEEMEDEDDAMELLGNLDVLTLYTHMHANWIGLNYAVQC